MVSDDSSIENRSPDKGSTRVVDAVPQVPTERVERESVIGVTEVEEEKKKDRVWKRGLLNSWKRRTGKEKRL